jgi:hypothetical protein
MFAEHQERIPGICCFSWKNAGCFVENAECAGLVAGGCAGLTFCRS